MKRIGQDAGTSGYCPSTLWIIASCSLQDQIYKGAKGAGATAPPPAGGSSGRAPVEQYNNKNLVSVILFIEMHKTLL